jgi:DNA repair protein RadC
MLNTTYALPETDLVLTHGVAPAGATDGAQAASNIKIYKIRDLPAESRPREKLLKYGPGALSTKELLAVILMTGTKKEGVLEMANRIIRDYGEKTLMTSNNIAQLAEELKLPLVKTAQVAASLELGRRLYDRNAAGLPVIRNAKDVYSHLKDMRELNKEHLRGLYLNAHQRVIHDEVISIGTVNSNLIHPREVFKPALEYGAAAVILAHNHPSGSTKPSAADIAVTKQLVEAGKLVGISLLDHVIITKKGFASVEVDYS